MKRWHQFTNATQPPFFAFGTDAEAARYLAERRGRVAANRYEMTSLDEGEEPVDNAVVVDLATGDTLPDRHRRKSSHG